MRGCFVEWEQKQMGKGESPMEILDNRFAKGEISKEEQEEQKRTINSKN